jgi:hypothetical protein
VSRALFLSCARAYTFLLQSASFGKRRRTYPIGENSSLSLSLSLSKGFYPSLFSSVIALNHRRLEGLLFFISIAFFVSIACNTIDPCN